MQWRQLVGQERAKLCLDAAMASGKLGHAYLFAGDSGTGKFAAAIELTMAVLCRASEETRPCYECESCRKVLHYSHPDLHVIMPVLLDKEHRGSDGKLKDEGWQYISHTVAARIGNPYLPQDVSGIASIPVEWVREVNQAINRGALDKGKNVAILDGIDMMNKDAANAMLKTLEEPPPNTLMILLTDRFHAVLPTIISRCQVLRFAFLSPEQIQSQLVARYSVDESDPRVRHASFTGSLGRAVFAFEHPSDEIVKEAAVFWAACQDGAWPQIIEAVDKLSKLDDVGAYEKFFIEMMNLLRGAFFRNLGGTEKYFTVDGAPAIGLHGIETAEELSRIARVCEDAIGWVRARGNTGLVFVNFAIAMMETINGKK